jgi:hypothetical protein
VGSAVDGDDTIDKWQDLFQKVNDELATDTMELSNLENQVDKGRNSRIYLSCFDVHGLQAAINAANNKYLQRK